MDGWTVGQVAEAAGLTVRTLHHWEQVGLLVPSGRTAAGYRTYDADDVARLQRVLAYRELGFGLDEVRGLLDGEGDVVDAMHRQSILLRDRASRLLEMAAALDRNTEARRMGIELEPHELLEVFGDQDPTVHAPEARERWGETDAYRQSQERTRRYRKQDWLRLRDAQEDLERRLAEAFTAGAAPDSDQAVALAEEHRVALTAFYDCSHEMHRGLGQLYVDDERFTAHYDQRAPGLAAWLHEAIAANASRHSG